MRYCNYIETNRERLTELFKQLKLKIPSKKEMLDFNKVEDIAQFTYDQCEKMVPAGFPSKINDKNWLEEELKQHVKLTAKMMTVFGENSAVLEKTKKISYNSFYLDTSRRGIPLRDKYSDEKASSKVKNKILDYLKVDPKRSVVIDPLVYFLITQENHAVWNKISLRPTFKGAIDSFNLFKRVLATYAHPDINYYLYERIYGTYLFSSIADRQSLFYTTDNDKLYSEWAKYFSLVCLLPIVSGRRTMMELFMNYPDLLFNQDEEFVPFSIGLCKQRQLDRLADVILQLCFVTIPVMDNYFWYMVSGNNAHLSNLLEEVYYEMPTIALPEIGSSKDLDTLLFDSDEIRNVSYVFNTLAGEFDTIFDIQKKQFNQSIIEWTFGKGDIESNIASLIEKAKQELLSHE